MLDFLRGIRKKSKKSASNTPQRMKICKIGCYYEEKSAEYTTNRCPGIVPSVPSVREGLSVCGAFRTYVILEICRCAKPQSDYLLSPPLL